jgi:hypothetical protein
MDKPDSPEVGGASAANAGHRKDKKSSTQQIPDQSVVSNRRLPHSQHGVSLSELKRISYRVSCDSRSWSFSLRYSAEAKVDRLIRARAGRAP